MIKKSKRHDGINFNKISQKHLSPQKPKWAKKRKRNGKKLTRTLHCIAGCWECCALWRPSTGCLNSRLSSIVSLIRSRMSSIFSSSMDYSSLSLPLLPSSSSMGSSTIALMKLNLPLRIASKCNFKFIHKHHCDISSCATRHNTVRLNPNALLYCCNSNYYSFTWLTTHGTMENVYICIFMIITIIPIKYYYYH